MGANVHEEYRLIDPLDVRMVRGNRMLGDGVHGESLMPPWPSVFAGAVASRALAQRVGREGHTLLDSLPEDIRKRLDKGKEAIAPVEVEPLRNACVVFFCGVSFPFHATTPLQQSW